MLSKQLCGLPGGRNYPHPAANVSRVFENLEEGIVRGLKHFPLRANMERVSPL